MAKRSKSATKPGRTAKKPARPDRNEAAIDEFEREGMGVAAKE